MDNTNNDIYRDVHSLFYTSQSLLLLSCDPAKENFKTNTNLTPEDQRLKQKAYEDEAITLMKIYRALEEQVIRVEDPEFDPKSSGTNSQDLATKVKQAREALFSRVHSLIEMLTQH